LPEARIPLPAIGLSIIRSERSSTRQGSKKRSQGSEETANHVMNLPYLVNVSLVQTEQICKPNFGEPQNPSFWQRQSGRHPWSVSEPAPQACCVDTVTKIQR
jgi:hypothetical protein